MAHQTHNIPWSTLASNFKYSVSSAEHKHITDFYPRWKPKQGNDLEYFVRRFAKNIEEHSACERKKYRESYEPAKPNDVVLSDQVARTITPSAIRDRRAIDYYSSHPDRSFVYNSRLCRHEEGSECDCPLRFERRKMSAFLHPWQQNDCYRFWDVNRKSFEGIKVLEMLLLHGQMDEVLGIISHPDTDYLESWWCQGHCYDTGFDVGWSEVCFKAFHAYLCLNMMVCFPELCDPASGRTAERDYRRTRSYQRMVESCTQRYGDNRIATFPHRQFFGISDIHAHSSTTLRDWRVDTSWIRGVLPIGDFVSIVMSNPTSHLPSVSNVLEVRSILASKGLPAELLLKVMEYASYVPQNGLEIPHDPLHPSNRADLVKYLTYCWQLLVRCDMMVRVQGDKIPWENLVSEYIVNLWGISLRKTKAKAVVCISTRLDGSNTTRVESAGPFNT